MSIEESVFFIEELNTLDKPTYCKRTRIGWGNIIILYALAICLYWTNAMLLPSAYKSTCRQNKRL